MSTSVAANLLEMGFTQERAREAILTVRRLRGTVMFIVCFGKRFLMNIFRRLNTEPKKQLVCQIIAVLIILGLILLCPQLRRS